MPNWWIWSCVACVLVGYVGGCQHKQGQIDRLLAAGEAQNAQTAQTIKKHEQIATEVKNDYETRIAAIRSAYRVRPPSTGPVPTITQTTGDPDGATANGILAELCTETTQQLVSLQDFIKETR